MIQVFMFLFFCSTWCTTFLGTLTTCENIYSAICFSSILWSTYLFALTEGLSAYQAITTNNLLVGWMIFLIGTGFYCYLKRTSIKEKLFSFSNYLSFLMKDPSIKSLIIFITAFMFLRTVIAVATVPYNVDSMVYHLSRIMYWIQHKSVDYYETAVMRQIYSPVFAEYINLNLFLLTGSDLFANMLQNFSAYGCLILLYGLIKKLGCSIKWALFGCILAVGMNIFCAESLTTQVDMVSAFYLLILVSIVFNVLQWKYITLSWQNIGYFSLLGIVSGLIYITKSSVCIPATVIILYMAFVKLFNRELKVVLLGIISLCFIISIVFMTFARNYVFGGDFLASTYFNKIAIGTLSPSYVLFNVAKNLISSGFERNWELLQGGIGMLASVLNLNVNAPEISFGENPFELQYSLNIDLSGAPIIIPLFLVTTLISLFYLIKKHTQKDGFLFILVSQMFSLLIAIRWQPWISRLLLPSLVVAIIPITYYFSEVISYFKKDSLSYKISYFMIISLIFQCGIYSTESLLYHSYRALDGIGSSRYMRYFGLTKNRSLFVAYEKFSRIVDTGHYKNIGLDTSGGAHEYPILAKYVPQGKRIETVRLLGNGRNDVPLNIEFQPDIIFTANINLNTEDAYMCNENVYKCIYNTTICREGIRSPYSIWVKI